MNPACVGIQNFQKEEEGVTVDALSISKTRNEGGGRISKMGFEF